MMKNQTKLLLAVLALAGMTQAFATGPVFHPDITETGKNLNNWHKWGQADWHAENGEIVGTPTASGGGWLVFNKSYQDILLYAELRCTGNCTTGLLTRAEKTPDGGMKGVYLSITDTSNSMRAGGTYDVALDSSGKIVSATEEPRGSGFDRIISPWPPKPRPAPAPRPAPPAGAAGGAGAGAAGGGRRGPAAQLPFARNETPSGPEDWKTVQVHFDANTFRGGVSGGGGRAGGGISLAAEGYGPVAFYVGGTGKLEIKDFGISDLGLRVREPEVTSTDFHKQTLNDFYFGWGQDAADFNHDGKLDIVSGPFVYYGPDFTRSREIFRGEATDPTNDFAMDAHEEFARDFTGDGWPDVITIKFGGAPCVYMYVNPKGENRTWDRYPVIQNVSGELSIVADIEGPGKPALVYDGDGRERYAMPDPANPTGPWIIHDVSEQGLGGGHGVGAGDVNGDGRLDILDGNGWWENPGPGADPTATWKYHPVPFTQAGGAIMAVFDVNGDGLPDVVTSLAAHGWGLAWFEQKRDGSFVKHMVMDDFSDRKPGDVMPYSELHGSGVGDVNGDGIPDFITGKRWYSHLDSGIDPDTLGSPVLYWYETVRDPKAEGGARLVPHLINNRSGVGNFVLATDLKKRPGVSETDIVTSTRFGAFIFWGKPHPKKSAPASAKALPAPQAKHPSGQ